jgi:hypothetical protein
MAVASMVGDFSIICKSEKYELIKKAPNLVRRDYL